MWYTDFEVKIMISSVQKAMNIMSVISDGRANAVTLSEIAQKTGYPKPTCSHILQTLCFEGYTEKVSHSSGYILGPATYCLTRYGRYEEELISICRPVLRIMEKRLNTTVLLSVIQSEKRFIIDAADSVHKIFKNNETISEGKIYNTATGRAILAQADYETLERVYAKYGAPKDDEWSGVTDFDSMVSTLKELRKNDIVTKKNDSSSTSFARAIFRDMECVGAIGFSSFVKNSEHKNSLCRILIGGTKEIQRRLDYK